jgi:hypothetical protein
MHGGGNEWLLMVGCSHIWFDHKYNWKWSLRNNNKRRKPQLFLKIKYIFKLILTRAPDIVTSSNSTVINLYDFPRFRWPILFRKNTQLKPQMRTHLFVYHYFHVFTIWLVYFETFQCLQSSLMHCWHVHTMYELPPPPATSLVEVSANLSSCCGMWPWSLSMMVLLVCPMVLFV